MSSISARDSRRGYEVELDWLVCTDCMCSCMTRTPPSLAADCVGVTLGRSWSAHGWRRSRRSPATQTPHSTGPPLSKDWCRNAKCLSRIVVKISIQIFSLFLNLIIAATRHHFTWHTGASASATPESSSAPRTTTLREARKTGRSQVRFVWFKLAFHIVLYYVLWLKYVSGLATSKRQWNSVTVNDIYNKNKCRTIQRKKGSCRRNGRWDNVILQHGSSSYLMFENVL